jgi:hypothetical protein
LTSSFRLRCLTLSLSLQAKTARPNHEMFRFELSPQAPNETQGSTSSPRTSVLPTFDCQSAITEVLSQPRQPLIVSARNASVKRRPKVFSRFCPHHPWLKPLALTPHTHSHPGSCAALPRFSAGLDSTHGPPPKQPLILAGCGPRFSPTDELGLELHPASTPCDERLEKNPTPASRFHPYHQKQSNSVAGNRPPAEWAV